MAVRFGYRAVEEQYQPERLLEFAVMAEGQGFEFIGTSDHFHPWFDAEACAGFAWVWIASAAERTKKAAIGTGVTVALYRYNPAVVAQAFATLGRLYPGRIYLGLGTGEALNELPVGMGRWPSFRERAERLEEAIRIIKLLWEGDFVTFRGRYFKVVSAKLYTKPSRPVPLYVAASGPTVARMAGKYGDGFYTSAAVGSIEHYRDVLFPALASGAREAGRCPEAIRRRIEFLVSYDEDYDRAFNSVRRWRATAFEGILSKPVSDPRELERIGAGVEPERFLRGWVVCTDMEEAVKRIEGYISAGFDEVEVHSSSPEEEAFIDTFGREALPYLKETYGEGGPSQKAAE